MKVLSTENTNTIVEIDLTNPKQSVNDPILQALFSDGYVIFSQLAIEKDNKPVMLLFMNKPISKEKNDYSRDIKSILALVAIQTLLLGALLWM